MLNNYRVVEGLVWNETVWTNLDGLATRVIVLGCVISALEMRTLDGEFLTSGVLEFQRIKDGSFYARRTVFIPDNKDFPEVEIGREMVK